MSEFINTADVIGDDEMCDQIIMRTVTEYKEERITKVGAYAFYGCEALEVVELPNVEELGQAAFSNCLNLRRFVAPKLKVMSAGSLGGSIYSYPEIAKSLIFDFPLLTYIPEGSFSARVFKALVLRSPTVCVLGGAAFNGPNFSWHTTGGHVYVPSALVDSYKSASGWSYYADFILPLEEYTVDGTVTGELDETKI